MYKNVPGIRLANTLIIKVFINTMLLNFVCKFQKKFVKIRWE